ncbi:MAG: hypothetical protein AAGE94_12655 [Acidobacteriota bacterium]
MLTETLNIRRRDAEERARKTLLGMARQLGDIADEALRVGDLLALPIGGDAGVEWLVGEQPEPTVARLIPVDGGPWVGVRDVALDPASMGPRVARGALATDVPMDRLASASRVGRLSADDLERVRQCVSGRRSNDPTAIEVSADPDYRAWIEGRLRPAVEALDMLPAAFVPQPAPPPARPTSPPGRWLALAASIVLAVLATWTVARWDMPSDRGGEVALAVFMPVTDTVRAAETTVVERLPAAEWIVLAFRTLTPVPYPTYRLDLVDLDALDGEPFWSASDLRLQGASDIIVRVPTVTLDARRVEARLFGRSTDDEVEPLERWRFRVVDRTD